MCVLSVSESGNQLNWLISKTSANERERNNAVERENCSVNWVERSNISSSAYGKNSTTASSFFVCLVVRRQLRADFYAEPRLRQRVKNGAEISIARQGLQIPIRAGDDGKWMNIDVFVIVDVVFFSPALRWVPKCFIGYTRLARAQLGLIEFHLMH